MSHTIVSLATRNLNTFMYVKILKRPSIPLSSDIHYTIVKNCVKYVIVESSAKKNYSPMKVSSHVFIATSDA